MTLAPVERLSASEARWTIEPNSFSMEPDGVPEELQPRAISALRFGLQLGEDFQLVAVGEPDVAIRRYVYWLLESAADEMPACCDWCYVMNFADQNKPLAMQFPTGEGRAFQQAMQSAIEGLQSDLPEAFQAEPYAERRDQMLATFSMQRDQAFEELQRRATERGFTLTQTPAGLAIVPVIDGEPVNPQQFNELDPETQQRFESAREELTHDLQQTMRRIREITDAARQAAEQFDRELAQEVLSHRFSNLRAEHADDDRIQSYLDAVAQDILEHLNMFRGDQQGEQPNPAQAQRQALINEEFMRRYQVNLIVDHAGATHPPIVTEENPNYGNLVGKIERRGVMGTLVTDFTMIKPGALLRANGGFLVLDLRDLLTTPLSWDALKHALQRGVVRIEEIGQVLGTVATTSLEPEPIPLEIKVVIIGEPRLVHAVAEADPDFNRLFKIRCEFHNSAEHDDERTQALASFFISLHADDSPALDADGVARLIEESVRFAGDQRRLSLELDALADIAKEAMQIAANEGRDSTGGDAVRQAIENRRYRLEHASERMQQMLLDRTVMVDTEGSEVGQINGLTVMSTSGFSFGLPVRITARAFAGRGGIVDIQREVELGGPIHSKGVFILSGYMGGRYGRQQPLSLSASLVFEQTYSPVEGDSASLAELLALLSSLSDAPLRQDLAVTGSVNQWGEVQAIGGLNQKVEGFFELCKERGLTGEQGVVFPHSNAPNLMLHEEVVEAVAAGSFHLYPVESIDQAIELFTGVEAGAPDERGTFPPGSMHQRVESRLAEFAEVTRHTATMPLPGPGERFT